MSLVRWSISGKVSPESGPAIFQVPGLTIKRTRSGQPHQFDLVASVQVIDVLISTDDGQEKHKT